MTSSSGSPTWQDIETLLDELLDIPADARAAKLASLDLAAPEYASAARKALAAIDDDDLLDQGLGGVAGQLLHDLLAQDAGSAVGSQLSVYRLDEVIGRGGMGVVYRASRIDGQFDQQVAIKKIPFGLAGERGVTRFQEERTILASVQHPFIGQLLDGGLDEEGLPYLVMELVSGGLGIDRFANDNQLNQVEVLALFKEVCNAVAFLHRSLITHGDIKPSNILVRPDGHPKLIDFGIAKLATATEEIKPIRLHGATPGYASPEQTRGENITTQSDIFALGATLSTILLGSANSQTAAQTVLGPELHAIVKRCMAEDPQNRYATVEGLTADIDAYLAFRPVSARAGGIFYRGRKYLRRHWLPVFAAFAVFVSLVAGIVLSTQQANRAAQEARRATVISDFLISMFERSADTFSSDSDPTLYDLVEAADSRLDAELREVPAIKADMQEIFGHAYDGLLNDTAKAKAHFHDVLAYDRQFDPGNTSRILSMLSWIATMHRKEGDYEGANVVIEEAIEIDLRDGQPDMEGWLTKAEIVHQIGPIDEELAALDKSEEVYARVYGANSNEMAVVLAARALSVARHNADYSGSIDYLSRAIAMREANGGGRWVSTDRMRANMAIELHVLGRYQEALTIKETVIRNAEQRLGPKHGELASMLNNLGALYNDMGDIVTGAVRLTRALNIARDQLEPSSFYRMAIELNYARTLIWAQEPQSALSLLSELEHKALAAVGSDNALTAVVQRDRAWALLDLGDIAGARALIDVAKPRLKVLTRRALANKVDAEIAFAEGDLIQAQQSAKASIAEFTNAGGTRDWMLAQSRLLLDKIQLALGEAIDVARHQADIALVKAQVSTQHRALRLAQ